MRVTRGDARAVLSFSVKNAVAEHVGKADGSNA